jgi:hypothetical protein
MLATFPPEEEVVNPDSVKTLFVVVDAGAVEGGILLPLVVEIESPLRTKTPL